MMTLFPRRARALAIAALTVAAVTLVACSGADQGGLHDTEQLTPATASTPAGSSAPTTAASGAAAVDAGAPQPTLGGSVREADQFKTSAQLRQAISACFGDGVTAVTGAMLQTAGGASATGFLSPTDFAAGDDVIAQQVLVFDGDPTVARTGVRNDTVSLPLLAALQNVGNVVGGNCAARAAIDAGAGASGASCACSTHDSALAMLARCLPSVDPGAYAGVVDSFAAACATDDAAAVASLVASTAFGAQ